MYTFLPPSRKSVQALPSAILCEITDCTVATSSLILIKNELPSQ